MRREELPGFAMADGNVSLKFKYCVGNVSTPFALSVAPAAERV